MPDASVIENDRKFQKLVESLEQFVRGDDVRYEYTLDEVPDYIFEKMFGGNWKQAHSDGEEDDEVKKPNTARDFKKAKAKKISKRRRKRKSKLLEDEKDELPDWKDESYGDYLEKIPIETNEFELKKNLSFDLPQKLPSEWEKPWTRVFCELVN